MGRGKKRDAACHDTDVAASTASTACAPIKVEQPVTAGHCMYATFGVAKALGAKVRPRYGSKQGGGKGTGDASDGTIRELTPLPAAVAASSAIVAQPHDAAAPSSAIVAQPQHAVAQPQHAVAQPQHAVAKSTAIVAQPQEAVAQSPAIVAQPRDQVAHALRQSTADVGLGTSECNKFDYARRSNKFPKNVFDRWGELGADNTPGKMVRKRKYVPDIMAVTDGNFDAVVYKHRTVAGKRTEDATEEEWISWVVFERDEGRQCALDQLRARTVLSQRHQKLPADSQLVYPEDQQIRRISVVKKVLDYTDKSFAQHADLEGSAATVASFNSLMADVDAGSADHSRPASPAPTPTSSPRSVEDVALQTKALQSLRNGHRVWDSTSIDLKLLHATAVDHPDVSVNLLKSFDEARKEAEATDNEIMDIEASYRSGIALDITTSKRLADKLSNNIKLCKFIGEKLTACTKG